MLFPHSEVGSVSGGNNKEVVDVKKHHDVAEELLLIIHEGEIPEENVLGSDL